MYTTIIIINNIIKKIFYYLNDKLFSRKMYLKKNIRIVIYLKKIINLIHLSIAKILMIQIYIYIYIYF